MSTLWKKGIPVMIALALVSVFVQRAQGQQLQLPRVSQKSGVTQRVGVTDISITYSRPGVKGRTIWGDLVPYDKVWRTGANEATTFVVSDDVLINGQKLPAGSYSLHTIPSKNEWTIIFNKDDGQWGSFQYDEKKDALRIKVKPQSAEMQEWFQISFPEVTPNSAQVALHWEKVRVPFTVEVGDVNALTLEKARAAIAAAKPDDWRTPLQAANFSFQNKVNRDEAMKWLDQSIKIKETYGNLGLKARVLAEMGNTAEAISLAEKAIAVGKAADPKTDTSQMEKLLAEWRKKTS
ncbi:MAG TPA: DUF2911 domain-containing protein [Pyrinomonadaceae bacterium]|nr:DUF2911 domain-containing protein [Pyrinomonadaceae bacterium]